MKRKNTTSACGACRKRRAKCDGKMPCCSRCSERALQCIYSEDGRRPASRSYVDLLRARVNLLENAIKTQSMDVQSSIAEKLESEITSNTSSTMIQQPLSGTGLPGSLSRDASMNFDRDGEARYFGLASGRLEMAEKNAAERRESISDITEPDPRHSGNPIYSNVINEHAISGDLEDELIDAYFRWEQPWAQAVDEQLFREGRSSNGRYFSPLLLNCILACGSRVCLREDTRSDPTDANSAGHIFLEKARILLHSDLQRPTITTLQSLCILGVVYVAVGKDAVGWLHSGMAHQLALDMGLNFDTGSPSKATWLSEDEIELRRRIYWTCYIIDKSSSMYTGRVCTMLSSQADVGLPTVELKQDSHINLTPVQQRRLLLGKIQRAQIGLAQINEKTLTTLYSPKPTVRSQQRASFVARPILDLKNWYYDLPKELNLEYSGVPQSEPAVYTLHMLYHTSTLLLMKPMLPEGRDQNAYERSVQAATDICNVAARYRKNFGSFRLSPITAMHCTMSAILVFLNTRSHKLESAKPMKNTGNIKLCLRVLDELSTSWNPAKRIYNNLQKCSRPQSSVNQAQKTAADGSASTIVEQPESLPISGGGDNNTSLPSGGSGSIARAQKHEEVPLVPMPVDWQAQCGDFSTILPFSSFGDWPLDFSAENFNAADYGFAGDLYNFFPTETDFGY
ncbi:hypothetical protein BU24DRAFT_448773 [Aaosphaeria arxii CBS 175.79]|uniref:Zn(2)-C6 fungal-type domain-containing protein n=1 Tax=Aaosphaeria arxii CBS 175.79 TaxID=1450172 RepID=A0A6A5XUG4_9PLEO|nr:uncharacterized protein BU24DRAFT_448773 [Aaosphaeria arxii CBS 175.79]KAF2017005.1 hypothetical protein BU24DRAFT_448773 [Aaosphaeria arxii CBS 175.79]